MIKSSDTIIPLLHKPETVLDFEPTDMTYKKFFSPLFIFGILFTIILILSFLNKWQKIIDFTDKLLFFAFSVLSILLVFFNIFTDHQAMKMNLNIIWLNPFIIIAFITLFTKSKHPIWFRIVFLFTSSFLLSIAILPQSMNLAFFPIILIIILRSLARSNFRFASFLRTDLQLFR